MEHVSRRISQKTGIPPASKTALTTSIIVNGDMMTFCPGRMVSKSQVYSRPRHWDAHGGSDMKPPADFGLELRSGIADFLRLEDVAGRRCIQPVTWMRGPPSLGA